MVSEAEPWPDFVYCLGTRVLPSIRIQVYLVCIEDDIFIECRTITNYLHFTGNRIIFKKLRTIYNLEELRQLIY